MSVVPDLCEERDVLSKLVEMPRSRHAALGAPVAGFDDSVRRRLEDVSVVALPFELGVKVALRHSLAQALAASELSSFLHIGDIEFAVRLALVVTVIEKELLSVLDVSAVFVVDDVAVIVFDLILAEEREFAPVFADLIVFFSAAEERFDTFFEAVIEPVHRSVAVFEESLNSEFADKALRSDDAEFEVPVLFSHSCPELVPAVSFLEVEIVIEHVGVIVPEAVEVSRSVPVGLEELLGDSTPAAIVS